METASVDCSCMRAMRWIALGTPTVLIVMWRAPAGRYGRYEEGQG